MQLQGIKIEYFITGGISIIWVLLLVTQWFSVTSINLDEWKILLIPLAYVFGMIIDYISRLILNPFGDKIEKSIYDSYESELFKKLKNSDILIFISDKSPELYKRVEERLTRYRIARGFIINQLLLIIVLLTTSTDMEDLWLIIALLIALDVISFFMWKRFLKSYYKQQIYILRYLENSAN